MNKRRRWELQLVLLTIIGMIVSGFFSGYMVYFLTQQDKPEVSISPIDMNFSTRLAEFSINSFSDKPVKNIWISYDLPELNDSIEFHSKKISVLYNKEDFFYVDFNVLDKQIVIQTEKEMKTSFMDSLQKKYSLSLKVICDDCKVNYPNYPIYYNPALSCSKINNEIKCDVSHSYISGI